MRGVAKHRRAPRLLAGLVSAALPAGAARAATIFWDGTGTTWNGTTPWSTVSNATTPDPAAKPGASDIADFNISTLNTSQTVNLDAPQSAQGLIFSSTGAVLIQSGAGVNTLTLGTSGITINNGAAADTISAAISLSGAQTWTNGGGPFNVSGTIAEGVNALAIATTAGTTLSGVISGSGGLTKSGNGTLNLSAANTYTGGTIVNAGTLALAYTGNDGKSAVGGSSLQINNNASVLLNTTNTLGFNGNGPAIVITAGAQMNSVTGVSAHLNTLTLAGGTLNSPAPSGLASTFGTYNFDNNVFAGGSSTTSVIAAQFFALTTPGGTNFNVNPGGGNGIDLDVTGTIAAPGSVANTALIKSGLGVMRLSGANTFSAGVILAAGTLSVANDGNLGNTSGSLAFNGGTLQTTASLALSASRGISLNPGGGTFRPDPGTNLTISQVMTGPGGLTKTGAGTLTLLSNSSATSTFTGPVNVKDGMLAMSKSSGFSTGVFTSTTVNIGDGIGPAGSAVLNDIIYGLPTGPFAAVNIQPDGVLQTGLNGIASLTMTGGTVSIDNELADYGDVVTLASSSTATISGNSPFLFNMAGVHSFTVAQGSTPTGIDLDVATPVFSTNGLFIKSGPGTMRLSGVSNPQITGDLSVNAGTLLIGNDNALSGTLTMAGGALQADGQLRTLSNAVIFSSTATVGGNVALTLTGAVSGPGGLIKNGTSTLTLAGTNSFAGPITINGGALVMSANSSFTGDVTNFGTFVYNGGSFAGRLVNAGAVTLNADLLAQNGIENDAVVALGAGRTITASGAGLDNEGTFTMTGGALNLSATAANVNRGNFNLSAPLALGSAQLINHGSMLLSGGVVSGASGALTNQSDGIISGSGSINPAFVNNGAIAPTGGNFTISQPFTNAGSIEMGGISANFGGGTITNAGVIEGFGKVSSPVVNNGTIEAIDGVLTFSAAVSNSASGVITAAGGTKVLMHGSAGFPTNAGAITLAGGTFDTGGDPLSNTGTIGGRGTFRTGALTNSGQMQFSGGQSDVFAALTGNSGSKVIVTGGSTSTFYNTVTMNSGSEFRVSTGSTAVFFANVSGTSFFTGAGTKDFEAGSASFISLSTPGSTIVQSGATLTASVIQESALTIAGSVTIAAGGLSLGVSQVGGLSLLNSGTIDLTGNELIVAASAPTVRGNIIGGAIFSSLSDATHTLGYTDIGNGQTEVRYTLKGDANLDATVNVGDLGALATNYGISTNRIWSQGDFNYDGNVDVADLGALATNYGTSLGGGPSAAVTFAAEPTATPATVPEPAFFGLFLGVTGLARRRARKNISHVALTHSDATDVMA